jgi:mannose-6-phosphate isomerase-like protein (cupin superfamily)
MLITKDNCAISFRENLKGGLGNTKITEYVAKGDLPNCRLLCEQEIPVGGSIGRHMHINETEVYIITAGQGRLVEESGEYEVSAGDVVVTGHQQAHSIQNLGAIPLAMTAIILTHS